VREFRERGRPRGKRKSERTFGAAPVLTVPEVADYLRVHPSTIYRLLRRGELPAFKVGSEWRFNAESLDHWRIEQKSEQSKK
jgi:excisionase family DNA binding protein